MKKILVSLIGILCTVGAVRAQVNISFEPALHGQTLEGLTMAQVVNAGPRDLMGSFRILVKDGMGRTVVNVYLEEFPLRQGANRLQRNMLSNSTLRFGESTAVPMLSQTGRFPEGEFEYCFQYLEKGFKPDPEIHENCYHQTILPATPLLLIDPYNGDEICNTRPSFSWQPPVPVTPDTRYRIVVAPIADKQDAATALAQNKPLINIADLRQQFITYPPQVPDLVQGQSYAWQVFVHSRDLVITRSEIWRFTVKCDTAVQEKDSYREAKPVLEGSYYLAKKVLHFSFNNPYKGGKLDYSIIDLSDPLTPIKKLPKVHMQTGVNLIDLRLESNSSFIEGHHYLLKIHNVGSTELVLKFTYAD